MKNVYEVLRQKELEVSRLGKEVEALRVAAPLLSEGVEGENDSIQSLATPTVVAAALQPSTYRVNAALRRPEKIVDLGTEQIYLYKDLKVTFENGKVKDVEPRTKPRQRL